MRKSECIFWFLSGAIVYLGIFLLVGCTAPSTEVSSIHIEQDVRLRCQNERGEEYNAFSCYPSETLDRCEREFRIWTLKCGVEEVYLSYEVVPSTEPRGFIIPSISSDSPVYSPEEEGTKVGV